MKSLVKSALAAVAAGVALAGCATYDHGYGYTDTQPYYGYDYGDSYGYDYGSNSYDNNYYRRGDNNQWRGGDASPSNPNDPWGGTNQPFGRNSQQ